MYENMLIPFDGCEGAAKVLHHATEIANWPDATSQGLSVAGRNRDTVTVVEGETIDAVVPAGEDIVEEAESHGRTTTFRHIEQGAPAQLIRDCIESNDIHALGMEMTGRRGTDRILLSSVAEKIVRSAPVPVMTVANPESIRSVRVSPTPMLVESPPRYHLPTWLRARIEQIYID